MTLSSGQLTVISLYQVKDTPHLSLERPQSSCPEHTAITQWLFQLLRLEFWLRSGRSLMRPLKLTLRGQRLVTLNMSRIQEAQTSVQEATASSRVGPSITERVLTPACVSPPLPLLLSSDCPLAFTVCELYI